MNRVVTSAVKLRCYLKRTVTSSWSGNEIEAKCIE